MARVLGFAHGGLRRQSELHKATVQPFATTSDKRFLTSFTCF